MEAEDVRRCAETMITAAPQVKCWKKLRLRPTLLAIEMCECLVVGCADRVYNTPPDGSAVCGDLGLGI